MAEHIGDKRAQTSEWTPEHRHEPDATSIRALGIFLVSLLAALVVVHVGIWLLLDGFAADAAATDPTPSPFADQRADPPEPRLQSNHIADMRAYRARYEAQLSSYGWIDREAGIVRVPIEEAMRLYLAQQQQQQQSDAAPEPAADQEVQP